MHALSNPQRPGAIRVGKKQHELFASDAANEVVGAVDTRRKGLRQVTQHLIANCVTVPVVEALEVIRIDYEQ